jgi:hypothetical protein
MSLITANGVAVDELHISMPLQGAPIANLSIDAESGFEPGAEVTIAAAGGIEMKGTVLPSRGGEFIGSVQTRVVAGKGGMSKPATPTNYQSATVRDIVGALLGDAGEELSTTVDAALLARVLDRYHVVRQPVATALAALLAVLSPSATWRILLDGTVWFGEETWPELAVDAEVLERKPAENTAVLGVDTLTIRPGVTLADLGRVELVEHWVGADKVRSTVTLAAGGAERGKGALLALARAAFPTIGYLRWCHAKVVKQTGQKVDVDCDDASIGSLSNVPIRHGLPGIEVTITPQAYVRVFFEDGDPSKPFVALWDGGESVSEIKVGGTPVDAVATKADIDAIKAAINAGVAMANDGGANLKSTILAAWPVSVGSSIFKVKR